LVERVEQLVARRATRGLDGREVERRTDHGGDGEGSICGLRETREPAAENLADAFGDADFLERQVAGPTAVALHDRARRREVAQYLADEERGSLRLGEDGLRERDTGLV